MKKHKSSNIKPGQGYCNSCGKIVNDVNDMSQDDKCIHCKSYRVMGYSIVKLYGYLAETR